MTLLLSHADILTLQDGHWITLRDAYLGINDDVICYLSELPPAEAFDRELVKYCIIIISTVPILVIYPFLQRYFVKGIMLGAVKG